MNNFIYENKTKVYFGQGSIKKNGIYDEILNILMKEGKNVAEFPGIMPNPTFRKVMEGVQTIRNSGAEIILGIGGGSVMDCCKAISIAACCSGNAWENFWERNH